MIWLALAELGKVFLRASQKVVLAAVAGPLEDAASSKR